MKKKYKFRCKYLILSVISVLLILEFILLCIYQTLATHFVTNSSIRNTSCKLIIALSVIFVVISVIISVALWLLQIFQKEDIQNIDYRDYRTEEKFRNYQKVYEDMEQKKKNHQQKYRYSTEKEAKMYRQQTTQTQKGLFDGLDENAAHKKFKELMKRYHPDNGGSSEMTEKIMEEYRQYKKG